jgi:hypothetical protein
MADGALVYRFETTRQRGERMRTEAETVTFWCRARTPATM